MMAFLSLVGVQVVLGKAEDGEFAVSFDVELYFKSFDV